MILNATQINPRKLPAPKARHTRFGLAYQRNFTKAFVNNSPKEIQILAEPWFQYQDSLNSDLQICSPDLLAHDTENEFILVVEVKTTWTPLALQKLNELYCPVVARATGLPTKPLVVCKTLLPDCPRPQPTISFALLTKEPLFHWIGRGPVQW